jgi:Zn-dependent peptidase ImmA (M78 family)
MNWREAHEEAMFVAADAHEDLAIDTSREIDVFAAIEGLGLELLFRPLSGAAGLYVSPDADRPGGILINSRHRRARRRYTGGHELGHHLMGHTPRLEPEDRGSRPLTEQLPAEEKLAEAFAAWFLMPPELVDKVLEELALTRPRDPADVYALALRLGTSFEATAIHLANLKLAEPRLAREWAATSLKTVKEALCAGSPPASYSGDVWALEPQRAEMRLTVVAGDRVIVSLPDPPPADLGTAVLSAVTETGLEEVPYGTKTLCDSVEKGRDQRVIADFGEEDDGAFRLVVSRALGSLPGLKEDAYVRNLEVSSADLGRRTDAIPAPATERDGSVSPIGGRQ